jgi:hypothetical protein
MPNGSDGTVIDANVLSGTIRVIASDTEAISTFNKSELKIIKHALVSDDHNIPREIKSLIKD